MIQAHLTEDYLWRGGLYEKGDRLIPEDLAIALGIQPESKSATVADLPEIDQPELPPALQLINLATSAKDLERLPTIGKGASILVFKRRPAEGYDSLEQILELSPELGKRPFAINWEQIRNWEG